MECNFLNESFNVEEQFVGVLNVCFYYENGQHFGLI